MKWLPKDFLEEGDLGTEGLGWFAYFPARASTPKPGPCSSGDGKQQADPIGDRCDPGLTVTVWAARCEY